MARILSFFKSIPTFFSLPLLSGILIGTSYIPFYGWALAFCYIPLWAETLRLYRCNSSLKKIFFAGWITQFTLTLIGFNWIYYVATEFGHLHWSVALAALLIYAALMHIYIPLSLVISITLFRRLHIQNKFAHFLILALVLSLIERVWPSIFEWNLAYSLLWMRFPLFQWADTVGFWGLSTWIFMFQAILAYAFFSYRATKQHSLIVLSLLFLITAALTFSGNYKQKVWSRTDDNINIAVTQGNVGNSEKLLSEKRYQYHSYIRSLYTELTSKILIQSKPDLVIWPETAIPFGLDEHFHQQIEQNLLLLTVKDWNIPVITGGYSIDQKKLDHLGYLMMRNAVFYLSPNMGFSDKPYYKTNLLAFGEYLPFGVEFPILYKLLPFVGTFERGSGPVVAAVNYKNKTIRLGPQICYDSLYPGFSRGLAENGAQILFNVTNDSWYGPWTEPYQHQIMTLARGVEVRRPLVRSTNTGISSVILANGTMLESSPIDQTWVHTYEIPYKTNPKLTFYTRLGHLDWIIWLFLLISLLIIHRNKGSHVRN